MIRLPTKMSALWRTIRQHPYFSSAAFFAAILALDEWYSIAERANQIMTTAVGNDWLPRLLNSPYFRLFFAIAALALIWRIGSLTFQADQNAEGRKVGLEQAARKAAHDAEAFETERRKAIFRPILLIEKRDAVRRDTDEYGKILKWIHDQIYQIEQRLDQIKERENNVGHHFNSQSYKFHLHQWTFKFIPHPPPFPTLSTASAITRLAYPDRPSSGQIFSPDENEAFFRVHRHNILLMKSWLEEAEKHLQARESDIMNLTEEIWLLARSA